MGALRPSTVAERPITLGTTPGFHPRYTSRSEDGPARRSAVPSHLHFREPIPPTPALTTTADRTYPPPSPQQWPPSHLLEARDRAGTLREHGNHPIDTLGCPQFGIHHRQDQMMADIHDRRTAPGPPPRRNREGVSLAAHRVRHSRNKIKRGAKYSQPQRRMWQKWRVGMPGACLTSAFALVRGGAASGNRTPNLLITRRPYPAYYGFYQRQQLQVSHLMGALAAPIDLSSHHV